MNFDFPLLRPTRYQVIHSTAHLLKIQGLPVFFIFRIYLRVVHCPPYKLTLLQAPYVIDPSTYKRNIASDYNRPRK